MRTHNSALNALASFNILPSASPCARAAAPREVSRMPGSEALKLGGHTTKKATVNEALAEYIQRRKQAKVIDLFGSIEFDPKYDYKKQRRRK